MAAENRTEKALVVYKYGTGQAVPPGAQYLSTQVQLVERAGVDGITSTTSRLVWHYFLVDPDA